jgi:hypothetical protein
MQQTQLSAAPSTTSKTPALHALPPPPPRLDELTPEVAALICDVIRMDGLADHYAAALARVSRSTLAKWKEENESFSIALEEARAWYELGLLRAIKDARKADGTRDWRAQAWLLKHASADGFRKPARSAQTEAPAGAQKRAIRPETPAVPAATERRAPSSARENTANLPETPARPGGVTASPMTGRVAPAGENVSFRPETRPAGLSAPQRAA